MTTSVSSRLLTRLFWSLTMLFLFTALMGCSSDKRNQTQLQIRMRNDTPYAIDNLWLGAGPRGGATEDTEFGPIGQGETTPYAQIEPVLANYRKLNFVANGTRYNAVVDLPSQELANGAYTFVCTINGDSTTITVVAEGE